MTNALTSVARAWRATAAIAPHNLATHLEQCEVFAPDNRFQVGLRTAIILGFVLKQDGDHVLGLRRQVTYISREISVGWGETLKPAFLSLPNYQIDAPATI